METIKTWKERYADSLPMTEPMARDEEVAELRAALESAESDKRKLADMVKIADMHKGKQSEDPPVVVDERTAFEAWWSEFESMHPDWRYADSYAMRWNVWKARAAIAPPAQPVPAATSATLQEMEQRKDAAYLERNQVVSALAKCFPSCVTQTAIEGWSEEWHGCVYIDLPTGQVSWHFHDSHAHLFAGLPRRAAVWDGHDTEEKYRRLASLAAGVPHIERDAARYRWLKQTADMSMLKPFMRGYENIDDIIDAMAAQGDQTKESGNG